MAEPLTVRAALLLVLDQVDYTRGACGLAELVGACLPAEVIDRARAALDADGVAEGYWKTMYEQREREAHELSEEIIRLNRRIADGVAPSDGAQR